MLHYWGMYLDGGTLKNLYPFLPKSLKITVILTTEKSMRAIDFKSQKYLVSHKESGISWFWKEIHAYEKCYKNEPHIEPTKSYSLNKNR